jgi:uncharacterized protein YeaO (DUF488 family)
MVPRATFTIVDVLYYYNNDTYNWAEYKRRLLVKLQSEKAQAALREIAKTVKCTDVTLLCYCFYDEECHRLLVLGLLEQMVKNV